MTDREPVETQDVEALQAEIVRLNKVVDALMDRSEASMNVQGSDFGLFQATVMLQDQVRLHTEALETALRDKPTEAGDSRTAEPGDMQVLRRTAALQIQLLELVVLQKDVGELIERVAGILFEAMPCSNSSFSSDPSGVDAASGLQAMDLTIANCEFSFNQAAVGAGMFNSGGSPTILNCNFHNNVATLDGGGMYNDGGSPSLGNVTFAGHNT
jgi:hypothetical protein